MGVSDMAQKKLLFLIILMFANIANSSQKFEIDQESLDWAVDAQKDAQQLMRKNIIADFKKLRTMQNRVDEMTDESAVLTNVVLRIFVSSSMPIPLLKQYHKQAVKYGGSLVFNGVMNGSFKELAKLVTQISESEDGAIQIDDESFAKYGVNSVPVFVLAKEKDCIMNDDCKIGTNSYDKITGNIGVKSALEKFAENGDLSVEAQELLNNAH